MFTFRVQLITCVSGCDKMPLIGLGRPRGRRGNSLGGLRCGGFCWVGFSPAVSCTLLTVWLFIYNHWGPKVYMMAVPALYQTLCISRVQRIIMTWTSQFLWLHWEIQSLVQWEKLTSNDIGRADLWWGKKSQSLMIGRTADLWWSQESQSLMAEGEHKPQ